MNAFELLKDPIKQYIWQLGWRKFYPIQEAAVTHILGTKDNYILSSRTASGKTEAAFLPAINAVENWHNREGVKILYISPLIALINDQFTRIEKLCEHLDIKITKWHGDASRSEKEKLIKLPEGILLITPESIEAMFVNHPENIRVLFQNLNFVIIDEIHSFLGVPRGKQLQSILSRLKKVNNFDTRYIGLSATLAKETYDSLKGFFDSKNQTKILVDSERNELAVSVFYFESQTAELPVDLIENIYQKTQSRKSLIFPNTRGRVEEIAVRLKKLAKNKGGHGNYFAHHSSIDRDLREYVENFAKSNISQNFAICCTSTLELGIDIGSVDTVVQVDSTFSIASLVQRLGRSGRIEHKSNLLLYATEPWSLLQSIACIELYREKFIEPIKDIKYPLDVLLQQTLSIIKEKSGITEAVLIGLLKSDNAFTNIPNKMIQSLVQTLLLKDIVIKTENELIIGLEGERVVNNKKFYSMFETEDDFKVIYKGRIIGALPLTPQLVVNENIFLGANIWKIKEIDLETKKIFVKVAKDGKKPQFFGSGGEVNPQIRLKMLTLLFNDYLPEYLDQNAVKALKDLRQYFQNIKIGNITSDRPLIKEATKSTFYSFTGTRINHTLLLYLEIKGLSNIWYTEAESSFQGDKDFEQLLIKFNPHEFSNEVISKYLIKNIKDSPNKYKFGKFALLLPDELKAKHLIENFYVIDEANTFLSDLVLV